MKFIELSMRHGELLASFFPLARETKLRLVRIGNGELLGVWSGETKLGDCYNVSQKASLLKNLCRERNKW